MASYLEYLQSISSSAKTADRKAAYLAHNFRALVSKGDEVLEIGPGIGDFLKFAVNRGVASIDVMDRDEAVLGYVVERFPIRKQWRAEAEELPSLERELGTYDVIFLLQVMEHIRRDSVVPFLQVLFRRLKPGGRIIITVPNGGNPLGLVERYSDFTHESLYSENSLRELVGIAGLEGAAVSIQGYRIPPTGVVNILRIIIQRVLHLALRLVMIANGGVFFSVYEPNITLVISRPGERSQ